MQRLTPFNTISQNLTLCQKLKKQFLLKLDIGVNIQSEISILFRLGSKGSRRNRDFKGRNIDFVLTCLKQFESISNFFLDRASPCLRKLYLIIFRFDFSTLKVRFRLKIFEASQDKIDFLTLKGRFHLKLIDFVSTYLKQFKTKTNFQRQGKALSRDQTGYFSSPAH